MLKDLEHEVAICDYLSAVEFRAQACSQYVGTRRIVFVPVTHGLEIGFNRADGKEVIRFFASKNGRKL